MNITYYQRKPKTKTRNCELSFQNKKSKGKGVKGVKNKSKVKECQVLAEALSTQLIRVMVLLGEVPVDTEERGFLATNLKNHQQKSSGEWDVPQFLSPNNLHGVLQEVNQDQGENTGNCFLITN